MIPFSKKIFIFTSLCHFDSFQTNSFNMPQGRENFPYSLAILYKFLYQLGKFFCLGWKRERCDSCLSEERLSTATEDLNDVVVCA